MPKSLFKKNWPKAVVINIHSRVPQYPYLYVGRGGPMGTINILNAKPLQPGWLGNPHQLTNYAFDREAVIKAFEADFYRKLSSDTAFKDALFRIIQTCQENGIIRVGCFCAPLPCHGDVIANWINA